MFAIKETTINDSYTSWVKYGDLFKWSEMLWLFFSFGVKDGYWTASQLGFSKHWCYSICFKNFENCFWVLRTYILKLAYK